MTNEICSFVCSVELEAGAFTRGKGMGNARFLDYYFATSTLDFNVKNNHCP